MQNKNADLTAFQRDMKISFIPVIGVEPIRPNGHWILSPTRLPIPPHRHNNKEQLAPLGTKGGNRI